MVKDQYDPKHHYPANLNSFQYRIYEIIMNKYVSRMYDKISAGLTSQDVFNQTKFFTAECIIVDALQ